MPDWIVRTAVPADCREVTAFNRALARETENRELDETTVLAGVRQFIMEPRRGLYFVAELSGRVIGQAAVTFEWSDWRNGEFWWLQSVYVHPDHRGSGVFRALYRHIEGLARADDHCCGIRLYLERDNDRARQAYRRIGLAETDYEVLEATFSDDLSAG